MSVPFPAAAEFRHLLDDVCMALFQSITEARRIHVLTLETDVYSAFIYTADVTRYTYIHSIYFNISLRDWIAPA